jgi:hypothetical protein
VPVLLVTTEALVGAVMPVGTVVLPVLELVELLLASANIPYTICLFTELKKILTRALSGAYEYCFCTLPPSRVVSTPV